jgi:hypothetical protein
MRTTRAPRTGVRRRVKKPGATAHDLIEAGVTIFRPFVRDHASLFRITFQRIVPDFRPGPELTAARDSAFRRLRAKVERLATAGQLVDRTVPEAAIQFQAFCEGLGNQELRGADLRLLPEGDEERAWRAAFTTLVRGFSAPAGG